ncbi:MAG: phage tail sheath C-terminal domain-containing protein [Lachnospiraceae bacterium]|nr:phage tail sheath C-terminal domain-containing protein [Lachnospiraceae bacterium]
MGLGLPSINIAFQTTAITAISKSDKGTVALVLRDAQGGGSHSITNTTQIPAELGEANKAYIERTFLGYSNPPKKVLFYVVGEADELTAAYTYLATQKFDYLCLPPDATTAECTTCKTWIASQRLNNNATYKAVLPDTAAGSYAIVNFTTTGMTDGDTTFTAAQYCSRIAGLIAGTPMKISCTYAPLSELTDIDRLTKDERTTAVDAGEFILTHDGTKVKTERAVNSLVTTTEDVGEAFKKIKIVEAVDMINTDIRTTAEDSYIGKYSNSYSNKCLLITAIKGYFDTLESDGILKKGYSTVEIDIEAQTNYLTSIGTDTTDMTEQEIKEADTGSYVFIAASVKILDAIEDISISITL